MFIPVLTYVYLCLTRTQGIRFGTEATAHRTTTRMPRTVTLKATSEHPSFDKSMMMFEQKDEEGLGVSLLMKKRRMCRSFEINTRQKPYDTFSFKQESSWREANNNKSKSKNETSYYSF